MILERSMHFKEAAMIIANNSNEEHPGKSRILNDERYVRRWEIAKTLVYVYPNGLHNVNWLDVNGKYVYFCSAAAPDVYPIIGELVYTQEIPVRS